MQKHSTLHPGLSWLPPNLGVIQLYALVMLWVFAVFPSACHCDCHTASTHKMCDGGMKTQEWEIDSTWHSMLWVTQLALRWVQVCLTSKSIIFPPRCHMTAYWKVCIIRILFPKSGAAKRQGAQSNGIPKESIRTVHCHLLRCIV